VGVDAGKSLTPAVLLGDSLTENASFSRLDWFSKANQSIGDEFRILSNQGVGGERTDQIFARITDTTDPNPALVTVLAGTNDVSQSVSAATIQANLSDIYDALQTASISFIAITIPPRSAQDGTKAAVQLAVNEWIVANAGSWTGASVCDWRSVLASDGDGLTPIGDYFQDDVHFNSAGATAAATALAPVLSAAFDAL